jgi:hypothetical protein
MRGVEGMVAREGEGGEVPEEREDEDPYPRKLCALGRRT